MRKFLWCGVLAAGLGMWGLGLDGAAGAGPASRPAAVAPVKSGPALIQERIDQQIELLKGESLEESLKLLSEIEMFQWPGYRADRSGTIIMPLKAEVGLVDIEEIMSNRRFLKVMDQLAALPKEKAAAAVTQEIGATLPVYQKMFDADMENLVKASAEMPRGVRSSSGITLQMSNNKDHSPTLAGARLKLLALVLAAGNLDLAEAQGAVRKVVTYACTQRDRLYKPHEVLTEGDRHAVLMAATLYNRQILACGILQRTGMKTALGESPWEERRLTKFDARTTPYDAVAGVQGRVDFAKGEIKVAFPAAMSDEAFNELLKGKSGK